MKIIYKTQSNQEPSLTEQVERSILYTSTIIRKQRDSILEPHGINLSKLNILHLLNSESPDGLSQNQIRERISDKTLDLPRIVKQLAQKRYVKSVRQKHNRRVSEVTITPLGLEVLKEVEKSSAVISNMTAGLTDEEAKLLVGALHKIADNLTEVAAQTPMYAQEEPMPVSIDKTIA